MTKEPVHEELKKRINELESSYSAYEKLEKDLLEARSLTEEIMKNMTEGLVLTDRKAVIRFANQSLSSILGYESGELTGKSWFNIIPPEQRDIALDAEERRAGGYSDRYEIMLKKKDGEKIPVLIGAAPRFDKNGQYTGSLGVVTDITELKKAEHSLRESEIRFKALHNASFGGIAIHDKGVILECNQGLCDMTGYGHEELMGMNGLLLISEKCRDMVMEKIRAGYEKPYEALALRKNGEEFPIRLEARNVPYRGKQVRTVEFRDMTEHKAMESQLLQAQKMESVGSLAGGVAHDFNNMLGVIIGHVELALEQVDGSHPLHHDLKEIERAAHRSAALTRQLLTFARKQIVTPRKLDLNRTVESMLNMLRRLIQEDIDLVWEPSASMWPVKIDPSQIDQILVNLCINARDAIDGTGRVTIETGVLTFDQEYCRNHPGFIPGDFVMVVVSDNGCGMDSDTMARLFDPFFTTKEQGKGTGLGLSTVYGIVKQNKGFINVYSEPGMGSTFKIYLPRLDEGEKATSLVPEKNSVSEKKIPTGGAETILLVEDEASILEMTQMMLERKGYRVMSADSSPQALGIAQDHSGSIDLMITDVIMPEMNGRELAQKIRHFCPGIKVLFMSGYTANVIAHKGILDDGVAFLQKPFSMADLIGKVRTVLDEK
ncbi:MAG: PAS domain S-box protein [Desulfamplus sp.]|nr:PAS domain S-box protein [Desulfamplus sp.]